MREIFINLSIYLSELRKFLITSLGYGKKFQCISVRVSQSESVSHSLPVRIRVRVRGRGSQSFRVIVRVRFRVRVIQSVNQSKASPIIESPIKVSSQKEFGVQEHNPEPTNFCAPLSNSLLISVKDAPQIPSDPNFQVAVPPIFHFWNYGALTW